MTLGVIRFAFAFQIHFHIALCVALIPYSVDAQELSSGTKVDMYEFGKNSAIAVKLATQLDYYNHKCKAISTALYANQTDLLLKQIGGRSVDSVRQGAAKATGATPDQIRRLATQEVDEKLSDLGGCKSKKMHSLMEDAVKWYGEYHAYLVGVADLVQRNPGRNIFR